MSAGSIIIMSFVLIRCLLFALVIAATLPAAPTCAADEPPKKTLFLPKSATAAAYVLGRLSNKELIEAPRSELVFVGLPHRNGLDKKF